MKEYICPRFPYYKIGNTAKFENGWFRTEDPEAIKAVESNSWYRVFIWPADGADAVGKNGKVTIPKKKKAKANGKESKGGLPASLPLDGEAARPGPQEQESGNGTGRKESPVLQELEELVRGSGIVSV